MRELFDELKIGLASSDQVRSWSFGEVKKPETINYRSLKPEKDGLFDERIFGPQKDWECYCGKYKRFRYRGIKCEKCGVEVTRKDVRRDRMGHIDLAAPVTHIWFFKGVPSRLGYLLDMSPKNLEKIIYFAAYVITDVDEGKRMVDLPDLEEQMRAELEIVGEELEEWRLERLSRLEKQVEQMEEAGAKPAEVATVRREAEREIKDREEKAENERELIEESFAEFRELRPKDLVEREDLWREMYERYSAYFDGGMGAEAVKKLLSKVDLDAEMEELREGLKSSSAQRKLRSGQRVKVVKPFWERKHSPESMIIEAVPVIPPELRPMVQLDGGRFATSDLNDLYRRVINRNNRLKRLLGLNAPEIIINNEKRMLQEAVDALFDNGRRGRAVAGTGNRPLKSLTDMLKGKAGRFRQNLLGKRVDYSGRSVIVVGPQLKLHQCGLPKVMALELFKPFVMKRLVDRDLAAGIKAAKRMVERQRPQVWDVLREVIQDHPVLLNRAPTLHRLGIQAFEPLLVEGKAIQIHPLVCEAFNADFDGDQMAVHLPLSPEAQAEARVLMLSTNNVRSPASGHPIVSPSQDMVIGLYYLSANIKKEGALGTGRYFADLPEALMAYDLGELEVHAPIKIRMGDMAGDPQVHAEMKDLIGYLITDQPVDGQVPMDTTLGKALINQALPADFPLIDAPLLKSGIKDLLAEIIDRYDKAVVQRTLDGLKDLGFAFSTQAGLTVGLNDVTTPLDKPKILNEAEDRAQKKEREYQQGSITAQERDQELVEIWSEATEELTQKVRTSLSDQDFNPIDMMMSSGARGNIMQVRQIAGIRGLVANNRGRIIPRPIRSNFREGMTVLEYFMSTHGARKGLTDTALKTADAGYLTRRLVDVSQEIIVSEEESDDRGIDIPLRDDKGDTLPDLRNRIYGRVLAEDVKVGYKLRITRPGDSNFEVGQTVEFTEFASAKRELLEAGKKPADGRPTGGKTALTKDGVALEAGAVIDRKVMVELQALPEVGSVRVRSPLTDEIRHGISRASYGLSMSTNQLAEPGEAVGVMAAQSIGEPGTQLTMRTFHTGGVADETDITHGLPRVVELFEARSPKGKAILAEASGKVRIDDGEEGVRTLVIESPRSGEVKYRLSPNARLRPGVREGGEVAAGDQLTDGPLDPKEVCLIKGVRACQQYLVDQVQDVYRNQGVEIHDKHIELIVRQMLRKVRIIEPNDTDFLPMQMVDQGEFRDTNRELAAAGKQPAEGRPELMGITKASLATESWLSAASFQETSRVLTEAAINGRSDYLRGLKENVIIGKLIPAGTGSDEYQKLQPELSQAQITPPLTGADWLAVREMEVFTEEVAGEAEDKAAQAEEARARAEEKKAEVNAATDDAEKYTLRRERDEEYERAARYDREAAEEEERAAARKLAHAQAKAEEAEEAEAVAQEKELERARKEAEKARQAVERAREKEGKASKTRRERAAKEAQKWKDRAQRALREAEGKQKQVADKTEQAKAAPDISAKVDLARQVVSESEKVIQGVRDARKAATVAQEAEVKAELEDTEASQTIEDAEQVILDVEQKVQELRASLDAPQQDAGAIDRSLDNHRESMTKMAVALQKFTDWLKKIGELVADVLKKLVGG